MCNHYSSTTLPILSIPPIWTQSSSVPLAQLEPLTDTPRPPLGESATAGNRGRKRAQQLPTTAHKRVERPSKRARTDTSSPTYSSQASGRWVKLTFKYCSHTKRVRDRIIILPPIYVTILLSLFYQFYQFHQYKYIYSRYPRTQLNKRRIYNRRIRRILRRTLRRQSQQQWHNRPTLYDLTLIYSASAREVTTVGEYGEYCGEIKR